MARGRAAALDLALYDRVVAEAKRKFDVWPSAYASGWVTQEYQRRGGAYRGDRPGAGGLVQWFGEEWVDVCTPDLQPCGRAGDDGRRYPKCRPRKDAEAMTAKQRADACRRKRTAEGAAARSRRASGKARAPVRVATRANPIGVEFVDVNVSLDELLANAELLELFVDGGEKQNRRLSDALVEKRRAAHRRQLDGLRLLQQLGAEVRFDGYAIYEGGDPSPVEAHLAPVVNLGALESQIVQVVMDDGGDQPFSEVAFRSALRRGTWQLSWFSDGVPAGHRDLRGSLSKAFTPSTTVSSFGFNAAVLQVTLKDGRTFVREGAAKANPCVPCAALALGLNPSAPPAAKRRLMR